MAGIRSVVSRFVLAAALAFPLAMSQATAASDGSVYVFRYTSSLTSFHNPPDDPSNSDQYDVTARFFGVAGESFESRIPTKPGAVVTSWRIENGDLPAGLVLDPASGTISGSPSEETEARVISVRGYAPSGAMGTYAKVTIDVISPRNGSLRQEAYGHTGKPFNVALSKPEGVAVYQWTPAIPLPGWVSMANGVIQGVPSEAGTWPIAFSGTDYMGDESVFVYGQIVVEDGPQVAFIPDAIQHRDIEFSVQGTAARSLGILRWELAGDPMPRNLALDARLGRLRGYIPTFNTSGTFRLKAIDVDGTFGLSNEFTLATLPADLSLTNVRTQHLTLNEAGSFSFDASEAIGTQEWEVIAGELPAGMTLDDRTGRIFGIPTEVGTSQGVVIQLSTSNGDVKASNPFDIVVDPDMLTAEADRTDVRVGHAFSTPAPAAQGGLGPYAYEAAEGVPLPEGVSLDSATGVLSGALTAAGNNSVTLVPVDSTERRGTPFQVGLFGYEPLSVSVPDTVYVGERLSPLTVAATAAPYTVIPTGTWSLAPSALPSGMSFDASNGSLAGVPTAVGDYGPYTISVTDGSGESAHTGSFTVKVTDIPALKVVAHDLEVPRIVDVDILAATAGNVVGQAAWSLAETSADLPAGLRLDPDGHIRGSFADMEPTEGVVITATDWEARSGSSAPFSIVPVQPGDISAPPVTLTWPVNRAFEAPAPRITNAARTVTFAADGSLPSWLTLDPATGVLSGTAPNEGTFGPYSIVATDEMDRQGTITATVTVTAPMASSIPSTTELHRLGQAQPIRPILTDSVGKVEWTMTGRLPSGLKFDATSGYVTGTPSEEGTFAVTFGAKDSIGQAASAQTSIHVGPRLSLALAYDVPTLYKGFATGLPVLPSQPTNAAEPVTYAVSGTLPDGIGFNTATGAFSGIPTRSDVWTVNVSAVDAEGETAQVPVTLAVSLEGVPAVAELVERRARVGKSTVTAAVNVGNAAAPLTFSTASGATLNDPDGFVLLSSSGSLTGVGHTVGARDHQLKVVDRFGRTAGFTLRLSVVEDIAVSFANVEANQYFPVPGSAQATVDNAVGTVSYELSPSALPSGLSFVGGRLSGVPDVKGAYGPYTLTATDSTGDEASATFTISVGDRKPFEMTFANVTTNRYIDPEASAVVKNAVGAVNWSISPSALPAGLTFSEGTLSGEPTVTGSFGPYTLTATDSKGGTATATFTVTVDQRRPLQASFPKSSVTAIANEPFTFTPAAVNAVGDVTWSIQSGSLPAGLTVNPATGVISGEPAQTGTWQNIVLKATDAHDSAFTQPLEIKSQLNGLPITLVPADLTVKRGVQFSTEAPSVSNEIGDVFFRSPQAEALGLTIDPVTGVLSGSIATPGRYVVDISVTDTTYRVTSEPITLDVQPNLRLTAQAAVYTPVNANMIPVIPVTVEYNIGAVAYTLQGTLPAGMSFDPATARLSGHPTEQAVRSGLTITGVDSTGDTAVSNPFTIEVTDDGTVPTILSIPSYGLMKVGDALTAAQSAAPSTKDGKTGDVFSLNKALPSGLTLNTATGAIAGTPSSGAQGIYDGYALTVKDVNGRGTSSETFSLKVRHQLTPQYSDVIFDLVPGVAFTTPAIPVVNQQAFIGSPTFEIVSGGAGLSLNPSTGSLSGTLSSNRTVVLQVRDDIGLIGGTTSVFISDPSASPFPNITMSQTEVPPYGTPAAPGMALTFKPYADYVGFSYASQLDYVHPETLFPGMTAGQTVSLSLSADPGTVNPYLYVCFNGANYSWPTGVCNGQAYSPGGGVTAKTGDFLALRMTAPPPGVTRSLTLKATFNGTTKTYVWSVTGI